MLHLSKGSKVGRAAAILCPSHPVWVDDVSIKTILKYTPMKFLKGKLIEPEHLW